MTLTTLDRDPVHCPLCKNHLAADSGAAVAVRFAALIDGGTVAWPHGSWEGICDRVAETEAFRVAPHTAIVIAKSGTNYGESQGEDRRPVFMILEVDGHLIRKDGYVDSYGEQVAWTGLCYPVSRIEKTIVTHEYE